MGALVSSPLTLRPIRSRSLTLDDPNATEGEPSAPPPQPPPPGPKRGPRKPPPGLRAQIAATREAAMALVLAHVELAKAEASAIAGQVGRVAALGALAIVLVIFAVFLFVIGISLGIGEWVFGSMGWGVIQGVLLFLSVAEAAVLVALGVPGGRIGRWLVVAILIGVLVGVTLGLDLPNQLYARIGEGLALAVDPGTRPLVVGVLLGLVVGLVVGIVVAARMTASGGSRVSVALGLTVLGALVGAFTAITFGPQVGAALGVTAGYIAWMALMGMDVARTGIDLEALKNRFYPGQTIETSKETLEWLQKRMPPGIGS